MDWMSVVLEVLNKLDIHIVVEISLVVFFFLYRPLKKDILSLKSSVDSMDKRLVRVETMLNIPEFMHFIRIERTSKEDKNSVE